MDHISNYLNFSLVGDTPKNDSPKNDDISLPHFSDLPFDDVSPKQEASTPHIHSVDPGEIKKRLYALKDDINSLIRLLELSDEPIAFTHSSGQPSTQHVAPSVVEKVSGDKIIEGVFSGEKMIGPDGHEYAVPPNYASKSKLVEGDHMKLTITHYGKFIYKQIGPIERKRIIGMLHFDELSQLWSVVHEGNVYKILTASVTFYKGKPGDHVVILVPKDVISSWGAVENIIAS